MSSNFGLAESRMTAFPPADNGHAAEEVSRFDRSPWQDVTIIGNDPFGMGFPGAADRRLALRPSIACPLPLAAITL